MLTQNVDNRAPTYVT